MRSKLKVSAVVLLAGFGLLQFAYPDRTNPAVVSAHNLFAVNPPPAPVATLLRTSCFDCHSDETVWPWYSHIAPLSWLVADDVVKGRARLNFSDWPVGDAGRALRKFGGISDEVDGGDMPLKKYTLIHRNSILTPAQRQLIVDWAEAQAGLLKPK